MSHRWVCPEPAVLGESKRPFPRWGLCCWDLKSFKCGQSSSVPLPRGRKHCYPRCWMAVAWHSFFSLDFNSCRERLYSLVARNTVACMAVKGHITFIDLKKGACQKLFHFLTISVGSIKDIIPLKVLYLCHNIYGLTMKDCIFCSIRHKHCPSDRSAEMQFSVTQRQSYTAPAWKLI